MNGKAKGSQFERDVCGAISSWWTRDDPVPSDAIFWRSASSGGRATQRAKKGKETKNHHGDITATDPVGQPFLDVVVVELKRGYTKHTIADLLDAPDSAAEQQYATWIRGLEESPSKVPHWLLIAQRNRKSAIVYLPAALWDALWTSGSDLPVSAPFQILIGEKWVVAIKFREFLSKVSRKNFEDIARGRCK